jgi:hypothetical protein
MTLENFIMRSTVIYIYHAIILNHSETQHPRSERSKVVLSGIAHWVEIQRQ